MPEAHAEVLCRRRHRYKYLSVVERPKQCSDQQLELFYGISPRGLTYLYTEKAGYINSAPLYICRVVSLPVAAASRRWLCLRQRRGARLGELQRARGRSKCFATAPAHAEFLNFFLFPRFFSPACSPPPSCFFARDCVLFDLEPGMTDAARASSLGCLFRPDIFVRKTGPKTTTKEQSTNSSAPPPPSSSKSLAAPTLDLFAF
jgi:hypothetical protein